LVAPTKACLKCGEYGHYSSECSNSQQYASPRQCFKCHEYGHVSSQCPNDSSNHSALGKRYQPQSRGSQPKQLTPNSNSSFPSSRSQNKLQPYSRSPYSRRANIAQINDESSSVADETNDEGEEDFQTHLELDGLDNNV
jgi:hypothetical protein